MSTNEIAEWNGLSQMFKFLRKSRKNVATHEEFMHKKGIYM